MRLSHSIIALALVIALPGVAGAQKLAGASNEQKPAQVMLLSKKATAATEIPEPPKPHLSLTTGPEFKQEPYVQRFWDDKDQRRGGISSIDDRADISVLTLGLHF